MKIITSDLVVPVWSMLKAARLEVDGRGFILIKVYFS